MVTAASGAAALAEKIGWADHALSASHSKQQSNLNPIRRVTSGAGRTTAGRENPRQNPAAPPPADSPRTASADLLTRTKPRWSNPVEHPPVSLAEHFSKNFSQTAKPFALGWVHCVDARPGRTWLAEKNRGEFLTAVGGRTTLGLDLIWISWAGHATDVRLLKAARRWNSRVDRGFRS